MELKVGDKVRWIYDKDPMEKRPVGTRGTVTNIAPSPDDCFHVDWETVKVSYNYNSGAFSKLFIKEFQPGDRVFYCGRVTILKGKAGTVELVEHGNPYDFIVQLDGSKDNAIGCTYGDNIFAHAPRGPVVQLPITAAPIVGVITLPPDPPLSQRGPCYHCLIPGIRRANGLLQCDGCNERFKRK